MPSQETDRALTLEAVKKRARLDALPALIEAAKERHDIRACQSLRREKGDLEMYVPALETVCHIASSEALRAQITQCELELVEAETTLRVATQFSDDACQEFDRQGHLLEDQTLVTQITLYKAKAQMYEARHKVEELRLKIANIRVSLPPQDEPI